MFLEPPGKIVSNGEVQYGLFRKPVPLINAEDFILLDEMDREVKGLKKKYRVHSFNYFGIINDEVIIGLAVYDFKYLGGFFLYVFDCKDNRLLEFEGKSPLSKNVRFSNRTDAGTIAFDGGKKRIEILQEIERKRRSVKAALPSLNLEFVMEDDYERFAPLALCTRNSYSGWTYTQKKAGAPISKGVIEYGNKRIFLKGAKAVFDWTSGYLRKDTYWLWAAGVGKAGEHEFAFNFSNGVNETSWTENVIWLDGKLVKLEGVIFDFDRFHPQREWKISTPQASLKLDFHSKGMRRERLNLRFIKSNFVQFFGEFEGMWIDSSGNSLPVSAIGFTERHFARW